MIKLFKNEGETPLECLGRFRKECPEHKNSTLSYAGRLDPMAEGELLVLINDENKERGKYIGWDKKYELDILFGVSTDTGDILGKIINIERENNKIQSINPQSYIGEITLPYPAYSSKTVNGKPLFQWAREGIINEIEIPTKTSTIYGITSIGAYSISAKEILEKIKGRIAKISGDFRQDEILKIWETELGRKELEFEICQIEVTCSSGTYMRSLAEMIGEKHHMPALAWKIKRVAIIAPKA